MGITGCLSFFPSKNLGGFGDGGMVVTNDQGIAERIRVLRVQGAQPKYHHRLIGGNFRLDTLQAAVLNVKFHYLDRWTALRQHHALLYENLLRDNTLDETIGLPTAAYRRDGTRHYHIYNQYVIAAPNRDGLRQYLKNQGVGTEVYYPVPLHRQECLAFLGYHDGNFPVAERACLELLALPIYPGLTEQQQEFVVQKIREFYQ